MINTAESHTGTNTAHLCGKVVEGLSVSHKTYGEVFYTFEMGICRNSGYEDRVIVMASERILRMVAVEVGAFLDIQGQIRTYNEEVNGHNKLNIVVFAREAEAGRPEQMPVNEIYLEGFLCKKPLQRVSPLGRKISDLMLAVNRMYNKSDYIPCIAWGRNAVYSSTMKVGDKLALQGRLQSRQYRKKTEDGEVEIKTAYEVSIVQLETFPDEEGAHPALCRQL